MNNVVVLVALAITVTTGVPVFRQILRHHPRGLIILFFTEMWERFSYYGMRGLLVFYLTQHFLFTDQRAAAQYGSYATLVYLLPVVGGVLADRYLGARKAVAFGALLLVAGHATMAIEGPPARQALVWHGQRYAVASDPGQGGHAGPRLMLGGRPVAFSQTAAGDLDIPAATPNDGLPAHLAKGQFSFVTAPSPAPFESVLYLALALIIMGVGFLKANISAIVGKLYEAHDPRRDPGFTLYYYGINLGAFWAAVLCGYLGQRFGWSWGFGAAGLGMAAGLVTFVLGRPLLENRAEPPDPERLRRKVAGPLSLESLIYVAGFAALVPIWLFVQHNQVVGVALGIGAAAVLAYVGRYMASHCDRDQRQRLYLAFLLIAGSVVFFTLFEQAATSLNLFADRNTDLDLMKAPATWRILGQKVLFATREMLPAGGAPPGVVWIDMGLTSAQAQSFNTGFILLLAPFFAALWSWLGRRRLDPGPMVKFGLGLAQVGLGFLVIVWSTGLADANLRLPLLVLVFTYLLHTTGEMCLSPVGMSEVTKLAPAVLVSTMMAIWFLATSAAEFIGALIAKLAGSATAGGQVLDPAAALATSAHVFAIIGWVGIGFGVLFLALAPLTRRWAHGADETG